MRVTFVRSIHVHEGIGSRFKMCIYGCAVTKSFCWNVIVFVHWVESPPDLIMRSNLNMDTSLCTTDDHGTYIRWLFKNGCVRTEQSPLFDLLRFFD